MRLRNVIVGCLFSALSVSSGVQAEPYVLDKEHAHLTFAVDHLGFSLVRGRFTDFDAEIDFDPDDPEAAQVSVTIKADSFISYSEARDKAVRGKSLLFVKKYPTITFVSKKLKLVSGNEAMVTGDLTLRGVTREESFKAVMRRAAVNELTKKKTAGFSVAGEIDRREYDMGWGVGAVGAVVEFAFDVEAYVEE